MITMTNKISEVYGKPIYSREGEHLGTINDVIVDVEEGKAVRLVTEELKNIGRQELRRIMKEDSIKFDKVRSIGDIVLLGRETKKPNKKEEDQKMPGNFPMQR